MQPAHVASETGPNLFIDIHWSRYDDSGVLHVCIEHVLIRNPDGNKEVDLAGQDAIHEALMLDDLELNGVKYKWRESTKEVYQRIEEDSPLVLVGTVLVELWMPRQLKYIEGINGPLVQLQLMDDTAPAAPHLYKIVVANCDMYGGRNSGDYYLHDVGMSIGDVIRGSAPMAMTEMAGVPRVHSTWNFSGWVRSGIANPGVWGMTVGDHKLTVNPSFDDLETTGKSLQSGEVVVVLEKKTLQVGAGSAPIVRARVATVDDKQGALLLSVWYMYLLLLLTPSHLADGKDKPKWITLLDGSLMPVISPDDEVEGYTINAFAQEAEVYGFVDILKDHPPMLTKVQVRVCRSLYNQS